MIKKSLPKGFRYFFTKKEVKELENGANIKFDDIHFGNIANAEKLDELDKNSINVHPISISAYLNETDFIFTIYLFGFRNELLPIEIEKKAKGKMTNLIVEYIKKVNFSKQTDLLNRPQLWTYFKIVNNQVVVSGKELR